MRVLVVCITIIIIRDFKNLKIEEQNQSDINRLRNIFYKRKYVSTKISL
jgi:hypothetical protein